MPEIDWNAQAECLRGLLGADAVLYWQKEGDALALPVGSSPPGILGTGFLPPRLTGRIELLQGKEACAALPLPIRSRCDRERGVLLRGDDGTRGGILAIGSFADREPSQRAEEAMRLALAAAKSQFAFAAVDEANQRSEARRISSVAEALPLGIVVVPSGNRPAYVNRAASLLLHLPRGQVDAGHLSGKLAELAQRTANHDAVSAKVDAFVLTHGDQPLSGQVWRFDGVPSALRVTVAPIDPEQADGWLWLLEDISAAEAEAQAKERQRYLEELNAELEQRVRERTLQLEHANEALRHTNLELQHFAHAMAHDLQAPLRSIAAFAAFLQRTVGQYGNAEADDWAAQIISNTKRLQDLIQGLLSYARLGGQAIRPEPFDLNAVFDEVVASLQASIAETGAEVRRTELPTAIGARIQIGQLLQNLIENALKYRGPGPPKVVVSSARGDGEWVVSVADNGMGIAPGYHEQIFEVFKRLHSYAKIPGTGIGLAACRRIVEGHGGRIWVASRPGDGSTFYFTLPDRSGSEDADAS